MKKRNKLILEFTEFNSMRMNPDTAVNPIGGVELYSTDEFASKGCKLKFIKTNNIEYEQFSASFVPWLSILDILMFNSKDGAISLLVNKYELV